MHGQLGLSSSDTYRVCDPDGCASSVQVDGPFSLLLLEYPLQLWDIAFGEDEHELFLSFGEGDAVGFAGEVEGRVEFTDGLWCDGLSFVHQHGSGCHPEPRFGVELSCLLVARNELQWCGGGLFVQGWGERWCCLELFPLRLDTSPAQVACGEGEWCGFTCGLDGDVGADGEDGNGDDGGGVHSRGTTLSGVSRTSLPSRVRAMWRSCRRVPTWADPSFV